MFSTSNDVGVTFKKTVTSNSKKKKKNLVIIAGIITHPSYQYL